MGKQMEAGRGPNLLPADEMYVAGIMADADGIKHVHQVRRGLGALATYSERPSRTPAGTHLGISATQAVILNAMPRR